jgi:hypothetical protein
VRPSWFPATKSSGSFADIPKADRNTAEADAAAPSSMESDRFHTLATRDSITRQFKPEDGGRTAFYQLRWVSTRGEKGPWSEVTSATVAA